MAHTLRICQLVVVEDIYVSTTLHKHLAVVYYVNYYYQHTWRAAGFSGQFHNYSSG